MHREQLWTDLDTVLAETGTSLFLVFLSFFGCSKVMRLSLFSPSHLLFVSSHR
jgi:hypothetical protein